MCGDNELQVIMDTFVSGCKTLFGDKLCDVRLYGSYARGDQEDYSDIDVLVLLDMENLEARKYLGPICEIASDISLSHDGIDLAPLICDKERYEKLKDIPGFYNNVKTEGVSMYAG